VTASMLCVKSAESCLCRTDAEEGHCGREGEAG